MSDRSVWTGTLSMGLVSVPISLKKVVDSGGVSFNQINSETGNKVAYKRVDSVTGEEVQYSSIVKGYSQGGKTIQVDPEDLKKLKPKAKKTIDIMTTVKMEEIDIRQLDTPYAVDLDSEAGQQAYALLANALDSTDSVAIGKFVMRESEHMVAIYVKDGQLVAHTLHYNDQIRSQPEVKTPAIPPKLAVQAEMLVTAYQDDNFKFEDQHNEYVDAVKELLSAQLEGKQVDLPQEEETQQPQMDLMAALAASVQAAKDRLATGTDDR